MKVLCVLGKHQYGDPSRGLGTEYAAFIPALNRLGCDVVHFESWNPDFYADYAELNRSLLKTVDRERPDVMLTVQMGYEIWTETLRMIMESYDVATISWTTDDSWKYREVSRFIGPCYHAMTTTYPEVLPRYYRDGVENVLLSQWAAGRHTLRPPIPAAECRYPVTFIGSAHGDRRKSIEQLKRYGIDVRCFGHGWSSGAVPMDEIPKIMNTSVISLNFSNSKKGNQIKARTFEVPGAGGFLLTAYADGLERFYKIGEDIDVFTSVGECARKIAEYLSNPEKRDGIARSGYIRTVNHHTYDHRLKKVVDFALSAKKKRSPNQKIYRACDFETVAKSYQTAFPLKMLKYMLLWPCIWIWGNYRGPRAARRIVFEGSRRFFKEKTFSASGWPGRMFYGI